MDACTCDSNCLGLFCCISAASLFKGSSGLGSYDHGMHTLHLFVLASKSMMDEPDRMYAQKAVLSRKGQPELVRSLA
jgi:hypothetical protein